MSKKNIYSEEFKKQIVELLKSGKSPSEIVSEYNIARSTVHKWLNDYSNSGSLNYLTPVEYRLLMSEKKVS